MTGLVPRRQMRREETPMPPDSAERPAAAGMTDFYRRLERAHLAPLWESLAALAPAAIRLAEAEGLDAHALSLALRLGGS